jgi:hypothetical protein
MRYYKITTDSPNVYPQTECLTVFSAEAISPWKIHDGINVPLSFKLKKKAILTDVVTHISGPAEDFLISKRMKDIFDSCNIMQHQYFNAILRTNKGVHDYYWLHLSQPDLARKIDFKKSEFVQTEWCVEKGIICLDSYDHYIRLKSQDNLASLGVNINKIVMLKEFDRTLDLFYLLPFDSTVYVSEKLKKKIEDAEVTGVSFSSEITI